MVICGLKISGRKNELMARVFAASENGVKPIKTAVEVEADLKTEYLAKLKIDDRDIPDPFKIPHGWMNENERMKFWSMLLYPDIFNYLMFFLQSSEEKKIPKHMVIINQVGFNHYRIITLQVLIFAS